MLDENDENVCRPDVYWRKGRQTVPTGEGKFRIVDGGSLQVLRHFTINPFLAHTKHIFFLCRSLVLPERMKVDTMPLQTTGLG